MTNETYQEITVTTYGTEAYEVKKEKTQAEILAIIDDSIKLYSKLQIKSKNNLQRMRLGVCLFTLENLRNEILGKHIEIKKELLGEI